MDYQFCCPCCGYSGLNKRAYERLLKLPVDAVCEPPYSQYFGMPSYDVCSCCGFEFGNDDEPGIGEPDSFQSYLSEWIDGGAVWFDPQRRPADWSLVEQLRRAGIPSPT
jgi:hypothetical protein